jgi:uncharacterized LabA/DUF88 family protein
MPDSKSAVFIDGQSLHHAAKALDFDVDFNRLLKEFQRRGPLLRAYFYTTMAENEEYSSIRPLLDWLAYNGFTVRTKLRRDYDDGEGRRRAKRSMGIEVTVDAMEIAKRVDSIFLFSGDGDFCSLVQALQRRGVFVTVVSSLRTKPAPMIADELRRQADAFLELGDLRSAVARI